ncbi:glycosyltransferase family 2 protein [Nocardia cyriacigeorgica]|uniref:glycosyltransferase n=1 Tax=Nocardia cyriacigeorgica TaxID=135487 RepID=UPI001893870B|nr:glycosyltransferase family 2 protein [Nocardia cyriacigeorgica]MBF6163060.1 glycosyltransferase family 2 protein [Nocardia cyriacigeorgica]MBF6202028.1 glycosyltransferase family 2 protein [Nocardia cyriacigeorgica]MBF6518536.1 glycosyltransferase family 2 protein [Nocardia cyriacigeorgica]
MPTPVTGLAVVIVTYNNQADLPVCLDALKAHGSGAYVVVRDCNSTDDTVVIAKAHPAVSRVVTGDNVGFGAACNDAVRSIERPVEMLLILNPDTALDCDLADVLRYIERYGDGFGCIGIQQRSFADRLVWSWDEFPTPRLEWQKARSATLLQRSPTGYPHDRQVDWVMGAFLLVPRTSFEAVGGFDERFFLFCEEIDLCKRLAESGRPNYYVSEFHYLHDRSDKATLWREVLRLNSRRAYDRKWLSSVDTLLCQFAHTYRWIHDAIWPSDARARRLALPRLLATWNLIHAITPPEAVPGPLDSWRSVRPGWRTKVR